MIRRRVRNVIECFARDRDYMRLANFELFGCFEIERKALSACRCLVTRFGALKRAFCAQTSRGGASDQREAGQPSGQ